MVLAETKAIFYMPNCNKVKIPLPTTACLIHMVTEGEPKSWYGNISLSFLMWYEYRYADAKYRYFNKKKYADLNRFLCQFDSQASLLHDFSQWHLSHQWGKLAQRLIARRRERNIVSQLAAVNTMFTAKIPSSSQRAASITKSTIGFIFKDPPSVQPGRK